MRVLALVTDAFGGRGGIARYNCDFLTALSQADGTSQITVLPRLAPDSPGELPRKIRQLPPTSGRISYSLKAIWLARHLRAGDTVFCGHLLMSPVASLLALMTGAKLWLQVHGTDAWDAPSRLARWGAEQADLVTSVSRYTRHRMIAGWFGADPGRIRVLPNSFGASFSPGPKPPALVERYGLAGRKVLLTVSRLWKSDSYKGIDRVIQALPHIRLEHPKALYLIAGDGDHMPELQQLVRSLSLESHVRFAGYVPANELAELYRAADVFIMPSTGEGFGIVYLEAAASGLHVIGGNRDGSADALQDGEIGEVIDPLSIDEIAAAVCRAFERPDGADQYLTAVFCFTNFSQHVAALAGRLEERR
jgi:phosphatidylinositol alpha-1,6-mannosyltransferase